MSSSSSIGSGSTGHGHPRVCLRHLAAVADLEEHDGDVVLAAAARSPRRSERGRDVEVVACRRAPEKISSRDHVRQPVGAEQVEVVRAGLDGERVHVDVRVGAERPRDDGALRVRLGFLRRELAAANDSPTSEWSSVSCSRGRRAAVGARVADMAEGDRAAGSTSATVIVVPITDVAASSFERWKTRRFASWISRRRAPRRARPRALFAAPPPRAPGHLAGLIASHPVGDREERRHRREASSFRPRAGRYRRRTAVGPAHRVDPQVGLATRTRRPSRLRGASSALRSRRCRSSSRCPRPDAVAPRLDARVLCGGELVAVERDVVAGAAADRHGASRGRARRPRRAPGRDDHEPPSSARAAAPRPGGRPASGAMIRLSCGSADVAPALRTIRQMKR